MKIVIAGAGATGFYLAKLLEKENKEIVLIDTEQDALDIVTQQLDIMVLKGDCASFETLEAAEVGDCKLFIAVTSTEKSNLLACILAKQLGAKKTIARVENQEFLEKNSIHKFHQLGVDELISPQKVAALEIERLLQKASFTDIFNFENGKISVIGVGIDEKSPLQNESISKINEFTDEFVFRGVALLRNDKTIVPNGDTIIQKGDYLYISSQNKALKFTNQMIGKPPKRIKSVMIIGDTTLALRTAELLEKRYQVKLIVKDEDIGKSFLNCLDKTLIINANPGNVMALKEEGLEQVDAFIALTANSETNIISSLMARENGVYKTIALVDNSNYIHLSQHIGIDTIISTKIAAAYDIFRFVRKGKVEMIGGLHGVEAEMIEFTISKKCTLTNKPVKSLNFPQNAIIAGIIRNDNGFVPNGESILEANDKVIVLALPEVISQIEKIFR